MIVTLMMLAVQASPVTEFLLDIPRTFEMPKESPRTIDLGATTRRLSDANTAVLIRFEPSILITKGWDLERYNINTESPNSKGLDATCLSVSARGVAGPAASPLLACNANPLVVNVRKKDPQFCMPDPDLPLHDCAYDVKVARSSGAIPDTASEQLRISFTYSIPHFRHLYMSYPTSDNLKSLQRFQHRYRGTDWSKLTFRMATSTAANSQMLISPHAYPDPDVFESGVHKVQGTTPLEINFDQQALQTLEDQYEVVIFYIVVYAPEMPAPELTTAPATVSPSPLFKLSVLALDAHGTPPPSNSNHHRSPQPSGVRPSPTAAHAKVYVWVYIARLLAILSLCGLLVCAYNAVRYCRKGRAAREQEALADLLTYAQPDINDAWSGSQGDEGGYQEDVEARAEEQAIAQAIELSERETREIQAKFERDSKAVRERFERDARLR